MAKQGMVFADNESGYKYSLQTANDVMESNYDVVLPEKSGTLAMLDDLGADLNLNLDTNTLTFTKNDGTVVNFDLTKYLDDTTNSIMSGTLVGNNIVFTREDNSTFSVNVSALYDDSNIVTSVNGQTGTIELTKSDVGLSNVNNTSDLNKPISNATQGALNGKQDTLVTGVTIKTINGQNPLGNGDISIDVSNKMTLAQSVAIALCY